MNRLERIVDSVMAEYEALDNVMDGVMLGIALFMTGLAIYTVASLMQ